jgi:hypothetical protein
MAAGIAVASVILLGLASIPTAVADRQQRDAAREWLISAPLLEADSTAEAFARGVDRLGDRIISHILLESSDRATIPGLGKIPDIGETFVSPALQAVIDRDPSLAERLRGPIAGTLTDEVLLDPAELISVSTVDRATVLSTGVAQVLPIGNPPAAEAGIPSAVLYIATVAILVVTLPATTFLAAAIRLGLERRRERIRQLALCGADAAQTRTFAAIEALAGVLVGLPVGGALFALARGTMARISLGGRPLFPSALAPAPALAGLVVGVVIVGSLVAVAAGTRDRHRDVRRPGRTRTLAGVVALAAAAVGGVVGAASPSGVDAPHPLTLVGLALGAAGLALTTPGLIAGIARRIASHTGSGVMLLAARRADRAPGEIDRPLTTVVTAVFAVAAFFTITGTLIRSSHPRYADLPRNLVLVEDVSASAMPPLVEIVSSRPGVEAAAAQRLVMVTASNGDPVGLGAVADCGQLVAVFDLTADCASRVLFAADGPIDAGAVVDLVDDGQKPTASGTAQVRSAGAVFRGPFPGVAIVDSGLLDPGFVDSLSGRMIAARVNDKVDVEALRTAVVAAFPTTRVRTVAEIQTDLAYSALEVRTLAATALTIVLVIAAASLVVGTAAHIVDRRKAFTFLRAGGVPVGQLRHLLAVELIPPISIIAAIGTICGVAAGAAVSTSAGIQPEVPWPMIGGIYLAAVSLGVVVWALFALPLDRITKPTELRFE